MSARSLNRAMLIGNLTRDPELRYTPNGSAVCTFGVATNRSYTPSDGGEAKEETEFHRVVAWGKLAEICSQLLYKGRKVFCQGRLQTRKWTGQDGVEKSSTEIVIEDMIALSPPRGAEDRGDDQGSYTPPQRPEAKAEDRVVETEAKKEAKPKSGEVSKKASGKPSKVKKEDEVDADDIPF